MAKRELAAPAEFADRWFAAAVELEELLQEHEELLDHRERLRRERAELFRQIVAEARTFVDAADAADAADDVADTHGRNGSAATPR